jgi:hypothetical protein
MSRRIQALTYAAALGIGASLLLSGCAHPVARKLEGRWFGDTVENFFDDDLPVATGWARGTSFEFSGHSVTVTVPAEEPRVGRFDIASAHDRDVVLRVDPEDPESKDASEMKLTLLDEGTFRWHLDDRRSVLMKHE